MPYECPWVICGLHRLTDLHTPLRFVDCSCRAEARGWGWCVLEGPAAETDVFVLPKSLPEAGREPCWLRPTDSCYSKTLGCVFILEGRMELNYSFLAGVAAAPFSLAGTDPALGVAEFV